MPLGIEEATKIVRKNFDRMIYIPGYSDYLLKTNLLIYTHELNLHRKIVSIYETRKRQLK